MEMSSIYNEKYLEKNIKSRINNVQERRLSKIWTIANGISSLLLSFYFYLHNIETSGDEILSEKQNKTKFLMDGELEKERKRNHHTGNRGNHGRKSMPDTKKN